MSAAAIYLHGALMVFAWQVLAPLCIFIARYLKVRRGQDFPRVADNPFWWRWHWIGQSVAVAVSTIGLIVIWHQRGEIVTDHWHARIGAFVVIAGWLQVLGGLLRGTKGGPTGVGADPADPRTWRGDHYDMTPHRQTFEGVHKGMGYAAVIAAPLAVWLGLEMAGAEPWLAWSSLGLSFVFAATMAAGEAAGWRVPTYRAIWGHDFGGRPPS